MTRNEKYAKLIINLLFIASLGLPYGNALADRSAYFSAGVSTPTPLVTDDNFGRFKNSLPLNHFAAEMEITNSISYGVAYWDYGTYSHESSATLIDSVSLQPLSVTWTGTRKSSLVAATLTYKWRFLGEDSLFLGIGAGLFLMKSELKSQPVDTFGEILEARARGNEPVRLAFGGVDFHLYKPLFISLNLHYKYNAVTKIDYFEKDISLKFRY